VLEVIVDESAVTDSLWSLAKPWSCSPFLSYATIV